DRPRPGQGFSPWLEGDAVLATWIPDAAPTGVAEPAPHALTRALPGPAAARRRRRGTAPPPTGGPPPSAGPRAWSDRHTPRPTAANTRAARWPSPPGRDALRRACATRRTARAAGGRGPAGRRPRSGRRGTPRGTAPQGWSPRSRAHGGARPCP